MLASPRTEPRRAWGATAAAADTAAAAAGWVVEGAILVLAAALRIAGIGHTQGDPFYDAAVRSMGASWHAFLVGAFDPSARLAIDKPPVDLWLQVASTRVFGFGPVALALPAALGGVLTVALVWEGVRVLFGRPAARAAALALAVLPVAVVTARSDTMDAPMAAALAAAFACAARAVRSASDGEPAARRGAAAWMAGAGALVGLAFEIKLFEIAVAVPGVGVLWWVGARGWSRRRRLAVLGGAGVVAAAVGVAWLVALSLAIPAGERPWAYGSTDGSAWQAAFVYDGWDRLARARTSSAASVSASASASAPALARRRVAASASPSAAATPPAAPGPLRLVASGADLGARIGVELAAAWAVLGLALAGAAWRRVDPLARAGLAALAVWLALGTVLFSLQVGLRPRYLEAFDPAVAACLGVGVVLALAGRPRLVVAVLAAILVLPLGVSVAAAAAHAQDSGAPGALPAARVARLTAFLRATQDASPAARDEVAAIPVAVAGNVIAHDGRPVLMLMGSPGHTLVGPAALARLVAAGAVRAAIAGHRCTATSTDRWDDCSADARWIRSHGVDAGRLAGQPRGLLYVFPRPPQR